MQPTLLEQLRPMQVHVAAMIRLGVHERQTPAPPPKQRGDEKNGGSQDGSNGCRAHAMIVTRVEE